MSEPKKKRKKKSKASSLLEPRDKKFSTVVLGAKESSLNSHVHVHVHILVETVVCERNASQKEAKF